MSSILVIDSGTTTTRVRLVRGGEMVRARVRRVGARDTAIDGHNGQLREAVKEMLASFEAEERDMEAVLLSGMITSNVGLLEVPHLDAPASVDDLSRGMVRRDLPELTHLPCHFVRGVRTLSADGDVTGFDVLRGEEVEVLGLRRLLDLEGAAVFMHYGSHHKAIDVDEHGTILASRTALTGELLSAVREHTILKDSLAPLDDAAAWIDPDAADWRAGMAAARAHGLGRALFLVRVGVQIGGRSKRAMTAFLLGALASLDPPLLQLGDPNDTGGEQRTVVLYGRGPFKAILNRYLHDTRGIDPVVVDDATAEAAAVVGATALYLRARELEATM